MYCPPGKIDRCYEWINEFKKFYTINIIKHKLRIFKSKITSAWKRASKSDRRAGPFKKLWKVYRPTARPTNQLARVYSKKVILQKRKVPVRVEMAKKRYTFLFILPIMHLSQRKNEQFGPFVDTWNLHRKLLDKVENFTLALTWNPRPSCRLSWPPPPA